MREAEAARGFIQLRRGDAEIEQRRPPAAARRARETTHGCAIPRSRHARSRSEVGREASRARQPRLRDLCPARVTVPVPRAAPIFRRYVRRVRRSHRRTNRHPATPNLRAPPSAARADVQTSWPPPRRSIETATRVLEVSPSVRLRRPPATRRGALLHRSSFQSSNLLPWPISIAWRSRPANSRSSRGSKNPAVAVHVELCGVAHHQTLQTTSLLVAAQVNERAFARSPPNRAAGR